MRVIGGPHDGEWHPKTEPGQRWLTLAVSYHGPPCRLHWPPRDGDRPDPEPKPPSRPPPDPDDVEHLGGGQKLLDTPGFMPNFTVSLRGLTDLHLPTSVQYRYIWTRRFGECIECWMPAHWNAAKCEQTLVDRMHEAWHEAGRVGGRVEYILQAWREKVEKGWTLPDDRKPRQRP